MLTRSYPHSVQYRSDETFTTYKDGSTFFSPGTALSLNWTNSVTYGDNLPGWRELLARGEDATTSLVGTRTTVRYNAGYLRATSPGVLPSSIVRVELTGNHQVSMTVTAGNPASIDKTEANNLALGKFVRKLAEVNTSFQGGVFLGELAQTLRTIKNPAQGLRKLVDDWRSVAQRIRRSRVNPLAARSKAVAEALADSWLEVQFGWRPLLKDIDDAALSLHQYKVGQSLRTRRLTAEGKVSKDSVELISTCGNSYALGQVSTVTTTDSFVKYRGAVRVEARDPRVMDPALIGFQPQNWLPTAWELVPYSFLIDYFTNIGDIINGWSQLGTRLAWCNCTQRGSFRKVSTSRSSLAYVRKFYPQVSGVSIVPAKSVIEKTHVSRAKYTGGFTPGLDFRVPGDWSLKWLNIAALIVARNGDRKWSFGD